MDQHLEASMRVGEVLARKYRVDRVIGVGGMGVIVAATHLQLDQVVALKFLRREALKNPKIVSRFEREARAAVRLKSEHVARIIDVGRLENGSPYIVMEYLEGQDLAALLQQYGTVAVPVACDFIIQACDAIAEAHSLGIVHRDLKPGNLFLANTSHGQQTVKVLDFGISKIHVAADELDMTRSQDIMGSPRYMSPEQMRSTKNVDGRTDVWSLGIILYELVVGQPPFHADTLTALCLKIAMEPLPCSGSRFARRIVSHCGRRIPTPRWGRRQAAENPETSDLSNWVKSDGEGVPFPSSPKGWEREWPGERSVPVFS